MKLTTLEDALAVIPDGAHLVAGGVCGTPTTLLSGLNELTDKTKGLTLSAGLMFGGYTFGKAVRTGALRLRSWHIHDLGRRLWREGHVEYFPIRGTEVAELLTTSADVLLIRVGPPDGEGWCSLGPSTGFVPDLLKEGRIVIAEVCEHIPRVTGPAARIHVSSISKATRATADAPTYISAIPDDRAESVARHVLEVIPHGATLQLGIGTVTDALVPMLESIARQRDLALLGMFTEAMIPLAKAIIDNGRGPIRTVEALGGQTLMEFLDQNSDVEFSTSSTLLHPRNLGATPRLVSINSAMAVDLHGHVVAETAAGGVISGLGGSADFFDGARLSDGGLRIIALPSMRRDTSTIVTRHSPDELISVPHHGVDAVITEHGVAWLRGKSLGERAEALIEVADPTSRADLRESQSDLSKGTYR